MELASGAAGANWCYGKVYRNGIAIGTEYGDNTGAYQWFSEDINATDWVEGDEIQLYVRRTGSIFASNRGFQICGVGSEWRVV